MLGMTTIDDINKEIISRLDRDDLYQLCMTNYYYQQICFSDPVLRERINKEIKIKNQVKDIVNLSKHDIQLKFSQYPHSHIKTLDYRLLFPPYIVNMIKNSPVTTYSFKLYHVRDKYKLNIKLVYPNDEIKSLKFDLSKNVYSDILKNIFYI